MQALMGPAKAAVSLAGNVLLNAVFGDQIDALKEGAAIGMTAGLVGEDKATVQKEHEKAKQEYAAGNDEYLNGDGYVLASRFLIDIVAGEIGSLGGKVAGRAIGVAPVNTGGPQGAAKSEMLGAGGTQTASKTLWKGNGKERIDVENPNPGQRPGQVHYQDNKNNKYIYDPETNSFPGAPRSVNEMLNDARFKAAIEKALTKYLGR